MTAAAVLLLYGRYVPPPPPRVHIIPPPKLRRSVVPDQVTGVQVVPNPTDPTLYDLNIGPNGWQNLQVSQLFERNSFDAQQLFGNIRLKRIIGNYGSLWSQEFAAALNANGIRCTGGDYFNVSFEQNQDGSYTVGWSTAIGQAPNETIVVRPESLADDTRDIEQVRRNIGAFLRIAGYTDLTTPAANGVYAGKTAVQAVAEWTFRY